MITEGNRLKNTTGLDSWSGGLPFAKAASGDGRAPATLTLNSELANEIASAIQKSAASPDARVFALNSEELVNYTRAYGGSGNSVIGAGGATDHEAENARKEKEEQKQFQDRMYQMLVQRVEQLNHEMADIAVGLREKYGEDFVGGMAAAYLSEEENERAKTDEERLEALSKVMLDENGHIKPEFAGSAEAEYVRAWNERQQVEADIRDYPNMNAEQREEVRNRLSVAGTDQLFRNEEIDSHADLDEVVEAEVDAREAMAREEIAPSGSFSFG